MRAQAPIARTVRACGLVLTAALAAGARHGGAHASTADLPCYSPGQPIGLGGAGYTPAGDVGVVFSLAGAHGNNVVPAQAPLRADAAGGINGRLPAPALASDNDLRESVTMRANDQARIGPSGPSGRRRTASRQPSSPCPAVDVLVLPWLIGHVNPRAQTTFRVMGWEPYRRSTRTTSSTASASRP